MPRFSSIGAVAERRQEWLDESRTVYQDCSTGDCKVVLSDGTVVLPQGANTVSAGGGVVAIWLSHPEGVKDNLGRSWPGAWIDYSCSAPDGSYALKLAYHSYGPWNVVGKDGQQRRLTDGDIRAIHLLDFHRAVWTDPSDNIRATIGIATPGRRGWNPRAVEVDGRILILYQDLLTGALVLDGKVIAPPGNYFYPDLRVSGDHFTVIYSPFQSDLDSRFLSFSKGDLAGYPPIESLDPRPEPKPQDPPPPPPMTPPTMHPDLATFLVEQFDASGVKQQTARDYPTGRDATPEEVEHFKQLHASVLYKIFSDAYYKKGFRFGVYPKPAGRTRYVPPGSTQGYAEDVMLLRKEGVTFWKDIGGGFGGPRPTINLGEFSRSDDADQGDDSYLVPPRIADTEPEPDDPPPPPPPAKDCPGCAELRLRWAAQQAAIDGLKVRVKLLEEKPEPSVPLPKLKVVGRTSRDSWHSHAVDLAVVKDEG